ncbi:hypothetical protein ACFWFF_16760 [Streptomyces sp. NPDC060223]|uniref:hypothetical protein n=1 Tax=Streptomyces sp. NPDC060223 TaxID=3347077 RepID=UPI003657AB97
MREIWQTSIRRQTPTLPVPLAVGALSVDTGDRYPLGDIAKAHDRVDAGGRGESWSPSPSNRGKSLAGPSPVQAH